MSDDVDLTDTIIARTDQLNADDLISGPITVTITSVSKVSKDQPIVICITGGRQPYKPCKTMRRILVDVWGTKGQEYVGKSLTLYRNPDVLFGGEKVGGIEISHMSGLTRAREITLAVTRGKKKKYVVQPLRDHVAEWRQKMSDCTTVDELKAIGKQIGKSSLSQDDLKALRDYYDSRLKELTTTPKPDATDLTPQHDLYQATLREIGQIKNTHDGLSLNAKITAYVTDGELTTDQADELLATLNKEMGA